MVEADFGFIDRRGPPAHHAALVAIDPVPHQLAHEAANLLEAFGAIELGHPDRIFVAAEFGDEATGGWGGEIRFARDRAESCVCFHQFDEPFEISGRQVEVEVEFADVLVVKGVELGVPLVERVDHATAELSLAAVFASDHLNVGMFRRILGKDGRGFIRGAVVDDENQGWRAGLGDEAIEGSPAILGLVPAGADDGVAAVDFAKEGSLEGRGGR